MACPLSLTLLPCFFFPLSLSVGGGVSGERGSGVVLGALCVARVLCSLCDCDQQVTPAQCPFSTLLFLQSPASGLPTEFPLIAEVSSVSLPEACCAGQISTRNSWIASTTVRSPEVALERQGRDCDAAQPSMPWSAMVPGLAFTEK